MKSTVAAVSALIASLLGTSDVGHTEEPVGAVTELGHGRYLVVISGCNDCHTSGWNESGGTLAEPEWLTGSAIGFRGPWGTTYPTNLRLLVNEIGEDAWVAMLHGRKDRPPMPWISTNNMSDSDARAIYRFIRSLGRNGDKMPSALPPDAEPATPYIDFEPQHLERLPTEPARS